VPDPIQGPLADPVGSALTRALDGLSLRQRVIANDTANIETPGYRAHRVDFESSLRSAMTGDGDMSAVRADVQTSLEPTRMNGNNVNLDEETLQSTEAGLRYQLVAQAMSNHLGLLRTAARGGA